MSPTTPNAVTAAAVLACAWACCAPDVARAAGPPPVRAPAAILVEPGTGDIVYERNADAQRPIASTTKLMTALVTLEHTALRDVLTAVPYHALPGESVLGLHAGERLTVADLLRGLLLVSGNDAAMTLAVDVAGSRRAFVGLMNDRARSLGLTHTRYSNPVGLDERGNYSSAADLVKLALVLRRNAFFRATTNTPRATLRSGSHPRTVVNRNDLVRRYGFVSGVKTGHTGRAGYVLVGSATRDGVTMVSAVLGDPSEAARDTDTLALLRYGLARYRLERAVVKGRPVARAKLRYRDEEVALVPGRTVARAVLRGERLTVRVTGVPHEIDGPLPAGARVGTVVVSQRGRVVASTALVTDAEVRAAGVMTRLRDYAGRTLTLIALVALAICSLQLVLLRRRAVRRRRQRGQTETA